MSQIGCNLGHQRSLKKVTSKSTVQLNYNLTIPRVNLHGSPQCQGWLLLRGIRVPRLFTFHECGINAIIPCIMVKPCTCITQLPWRPKFWKSKLCKTAVLTYLLKGYPSCRVEGSNWHRKNRSYTCIAETCVLHSDW